MINKYENLHIGINIERAVFKYDYKITTRTPFMFTYLKGGGSLASFQNLS
jgi:hypothetical protein